MICNLNELPDFKFFTAAKEAGNVIILTKDKDFYELQLQHGAPPYIIWVRTGNAPNGRMKEILATAIPQAIANMQENNINFIEIFE